MTVVVSSMQLNEYFEDVVLTTVRDNNIIQSELYTPGFSSDEINAVNNLNSVIDEDDYSFWQRLNQPNLTPSEIDDIDSYNNITFGPET